MNPINFTETIYLGDRACKSILLDGWNELVKIQVNEISRIRGENWNYNNKENIVDGSIVIEKVTSVIFKPTGYIPNDEIISFKVDKTIENETQFLFAFTAYSSDANHNHQEVIVEIIGENIYLEDPLFPGVKISE